jgi:hypothetical protein
MNQDERHLIDELFAKLHQVEADAGPRDVTAEALIRRYVESQPAAPYYMAQAIVAQQEALARAQERIQELERQQAQRPAGGFLSGLFGGESASRPAASPTLRSSSRIPTTGQTSGSGPSGESAAGDPEPVPGRRGAWGQPQGAGGSFLGGAMQTAMGVAGGVLIANALAGLLAPDEAAAAEAEPAAAEPAAEPESAGVEDDFGAQEDLGDFADMDFGGEF